MVNAIECRGVGKTYPQFELSDIDLCVPEGSVMGFVGANGAGKSTTMRIIMGLVGPDRGDVTVLGRAMPAEQIAAKWDIGFYSEDMRMHPGETIGFHLKWMASIFPAWDGAYADQLLQRFGLDPKQKVKGLSHGQRVKACLLTVLARRPRLLVLDEPTTGLDPQARMQILEEMAAILADEKRSILFSSHNTLDIEQISDQITFIAGGTLLFSEDKETLLDRWRRVRVQLPDEFECPPEVAPSELQRSGRIGVVTTGQHSDALCGSLTAAGATITGVERMTLEEIFLASVGAGTEVVQ